jgi:hypothetical protein
MMNPIRNIEKHLGPGGPEKSLAIRIPKAPDPLRRKPHNYPMKRANPVPGMRLSIPKMQEGGDYEEPDSMDEPTPAAMDLAEPDDQLSPRDQDMKQIVVEAMAALRGQHPDPEKAIQRFVEAFGEKDLEELKQMVSQEPDQDDMGGPQDSDEDDLGGGGPPPGMQVGGLLHGPGSGQDDKIEAATPTGRKVLLSDGEYVIDAPTVAVIGDGSTNAGARRLDKFRQEVRRQAYGHEQQAKPMSRGGRAMLEALNDSE